MDRAPVAVDICSPGDLASKQRKHNIQSRHAVTYGYYIRSTIMNKIPKQRQFGKVGIESKVEINAKCIYKCSTVKIVEHQFHRRNASDNIYTVIYLIPKFDIVQSSISHALTLATKMILINF